MTDILEVPQRTRSRTWLVSWLLRVLTAAGLLVDAYVHARLVGRYDPNQGTAALSQGDLFRVEAAVAVLAAAALVAFDRRPTWLLAFLVAASALGGLLLYRYQDPGFLGPLPDMYEPIWFGEKVVAAVAEATVAVVAAAGLVHHERQRRRTR
jgi:hypothetical protein